ncbi:tyrosine/serine/threonine protein phosphatase [Pseudogymnoascus australis]
MPVAAGPQAYHSQLPSFMSVYSCNAPNMDRGAFVDSPQQQQSEVAAGAAVGDADADADAAASPTPPRGDDSATASPAPEPELQHKHRDSTSTQASESTDSSPTTTISTADSSALTDPSPSSSPESPVIILPLSSFSSKGFGIHSLDDLTMSDNPILRDSFDRPMTSPSPRKPRNAKGLALKLGSLDPLVQVSAPASPAAFVKPPLPKPRKKPSNLSLQTSSNFGTANALPSLTLEAPPTPAGLRVTMLHHAASTSDMGMFSPDLRSSMAGPQGGMRLPGFERSQISGLSNAFRKPTPILESRASGARDEVGGDIGGDTFDCAANEDVKSPGYPDGPIAIYEPYVFLYLEPSAEEAAEFDVVMNVASEVKNPFKAKQALGEEPKSQVAEPVKSFDAMDIDRESPPMTGASMATFTTAFEVQPDGSTPTETSPTTPKPLSKEPEYIHIPWEHNTDISKDLLALCETIDDRVNQGKKVLIHCQQGASRSASLIIAYGMYRAPSLTVDAAYNAAQAKSKYVSPNINLMYALQDFRKTLQARQQPKMGRSPNKHRMALSVDEIDFSGNKESPRTAPLPSDPSSRDSPTMGTPPHVRGNSTPDLRALSPGPSSAPTFTWPEGDPTSMLPAASRPGPLSDSAARPRVFGFGDKGGLAPPSLAPPPVNRHPSNNNISPPSLPPPSSQNATQASHPNYNHNPHHQPSTHHQTHNPHPPSAPTLRGFAAHRDEHTAKRKPAPSLTFKPAHPLRAAPSLPSFGGRVAQPAYPPPAVPGGVPSPTLWSPRLPDAPVVEAALWSPRLPAASFQLPALAGAAPLPSFFQAQPHAQGPTFGQRPRTAVATAVPPPLSHFIPAVPTAEMDRNNTEIETPPTPTLMSPLVGDFGIQPFAQVWDADPGMERLERAPGFRKKKSAVFVKGGLGVGVDKDKELPRLPGAGAGAGERGVISVGDFGSLGGLLGGDWVEEEVEEEGWKGKAGRKRLWILGVRGWGVGGRGW